MSNDVSGIILWNGALSRSRSIWFQNIYDSFRFNKDEVVLCSWISFLSVVCFSPYWGNWPTSSLPLIVAPKEIVLYTLDVWALLWPCYLSSSASFRNTDSFLQSLRIRKNGLRLPQLLSQDGLDCCSGYYIKHQAPPFPVAAHFTNTINPS